MTSRVRRTRQDVGRGRATPLAAVALFLAGCGTGTGPDDNRPPTGSIAAPADGATFTRGESIEFEGSGSDPEDGGLAAGALVWRSSLDGQLGTGAAFSRSDLSAGDHTITLTATDSRGATGQASVAIVVEDNEPPAPTVEAPIDGTSFVEGTSVDFQGSATDPEDGSLAGAALVWTSSIDGQIGTGASFSRADLSRGMHDIRLTATDSDGTSGETTIGLAITSVDNDPPSASIQGPVDGTIFDVGQTVSFQGTGTDPEDGALSGASLEWISSRDGEIGTGASFELDDLSIGTHDVTFRARDSEGAVGTAEITVFVYTPSNPAAYDIRLEFAPGTDPTEAQREAFENAAARWEELVTGDLEDGILSDSFSCAGIDELSFDDRVDDVVIYASVREIDGPGGTLGQAGPCLLREGSLLPGVGGMRFDVEDLEDLEAGGHLEDVILHEMGHVLGFGTLWGALDLVRDPSNPAQGVTRELSAVADATVSAGSPDANFGIPGTEAASESIVAGADLGDWTSGPPDEVLMGLVRFELSGVPAGMNLDLALLELTVSGRAEPTGDPLRTVELSRATAAWTEGGVTWNTRPGLASPPVFSYSHRTCRPECVLDVTDAAAAWLAGTSNHGLGFFAPQAETSPDFNVGYHSRHAAASGQRPLLTLLPDTHFDGAGGRQAFDDLGGASYGKDKVPVENNAVRFGGGSLDGHWREGVLVNELMTPALNQGTDNPLSRLSVEALADMGYVVDAAAADAFSVDLSVRAAARAVEGPGAGAGALLLLDDVWRGPVRVLRSVGRTLRPEAPGARAVREGPPRWAPGRLVPGSGAGGGARLRDPAGEPR